MVETLLLDGDDLLYEVALLLKFGISGNVFGDDRFAEGGKERILYSEQLAVTRRAAEQTAENISASFV